MEIRRHMNFSVNPDFREKRFRINRNLSHFSWKLKHPPSIAIISSIHTSSLHFFCLFQNQQETHHCVLIPRPVCNDLLEKQFKNCLYWLPVFRCEHVHHVNTVAHLNWTSESDTCGVLQPLQRCHVLHRYRCCSSSVEHRWIQMWLSHTSRYLHSSTGVPGTVYWGIGVQCHLCFYF